MTDHPGPDEAEREENVRLAEFALWNLPPKESLSPDEVRALTRPVLRELDRLRTENADLRRQAADELARLGQEMGLDEAEPVTFTGDEVMQMVAEFNDRCEALSAGLRGMARRSIHQRRWAGRATAKSHNSLRAYEHLLRKLGSAVGVHVGHPGEQRYPEFVERICAAALDARAKNADLLADVATISRIGHETETELRAELADLKAGRASGATEEAYLLAILTDCAHVMFGDDKDTARQMVSYGIELHRMHLRNRTPPSMTPTPGPTSCPGCRTVAPASHVEGCPHAPDGALDVLRRLVGLWDARASDASWANAWAAGWTEARALLGGAA